MFNFKKGGDKPIEVLTIKDVMNSEESVFLCLEDDDILYKSDSGEFFWILEKRIEYLGCDDDVAKNLYEENTFIVYDKKIVLEISN